MSFQIGDVVGNYRVTGLLGSGGSGQVYRVEHTITGQIEAIKVLLRSDGSDSAGQAERFLREIQVQARLHHPNVAAVHNAFWADDRLVMVMEYVEGEALDERLARGRIPLAEGVAYTQQVLSALSYAHAQGVIHRDIKPANIIITRQNGTVKVTDFGLARSESDPKLTQSGAVVGSLYYISPEQVRALPAIDGRADIYSLGAVFYEVATGRKPFPLDQTFELLMAHVHQVPDPPIQLESSLPPKLSDVILRAMAKDPAERFQSADEFLEAAREAFGDQEAEANRNAPATEKRGRSEKRAASRARHLRPRVTAALALVAAVVALFSALLMSRQRAQVSEASASGEFELLRGLRVDAGVTAAAFSPDNRWVAAGTGNGQIKVWSARTAQEYASLRGHEGAITALAFSADGGRLASGGADKKVRLWDLSTRQAIATMEHPAGIVSVAFSADGGKVAAGASDRVIRVWDANTGDGPLALSTQIEPLRIAFAPDKERLAAAGAETKVQLWNLEQSTTASQLLEVGSGIVAMRFLSNGLLATISGTGLQEWDPVSLRERKRVATPPAASTFAYTSRGDCIILTMREGSVTAHGAAGEQDIARLQHSRPVAAALLNADGLKAATYGTGGDFWLWQATPSLEARATPDQAAEEAKPTPFAKAEEETAIGDDSERPARKAERNPKRKRGVFRRFLGIFR